MTTAVNGKPTQGQGILGPKAQARKKLENEYRVLLVHVHRQRVGLLGLYGKGLKGDTPGTVDPEQVVDPKSFLTSEQLRELNLLEEQALELTAKIRELIKERNNAREKSRFRDSGAARHGMPGTVDAAGKLDAIRILLHAQVTVTKNDEGFQIVDIAELEKWNNCSRLQKVANCDRLTRDHCVMVKRAAEGDGLALKEFYRCYSHKSLPKAKQEGSPADRFVANMMARPVENRVELIYRWSGMTPEFCEHAAKTPKDVPVIELKMSNLSFVGDIRPLVEDALKRRWEIIEGSDKITGGQESQPIDWRDNADRTSFVTRKNQDYVRESQEYSRRNGNFVRK